MSRGCFTILLLNVKNNFEINHIKIKLYIYIYFVLHTAKIKILRSLFEIHTATVYRICHIMLKCLSELCYKSVKFPTVSEFNELSIRISGDMKNHGVILAIYEYHVEINKPTSNFMAYYNKNRYFSICFGAVCDYKKCIGGLTYNWES